MKKQIKEQFSYHLGYYLWKYYSKCISFSVGALLTSQSEDTVKGILRLELEERIENEKDTD